MIKSEYHRLGTVFFLIVGIAWIARTDASADPVPLRVVAFSDQQAPGTSGDTRFINFAYPVINNAGETAFRATVGPSGSSPVQPGLWFEGGGRLNLASLEGSQPNLDFSDVRFAYNDQAKLVFQGSDGIWLATSDGISSIAKVGGEVPGQPQSIFSSVGRPTINKDGTIAFAATAQSSCCRDGAVFTASSLGFSIVARSGTIPGTNPPEYIQPYPGTPKINSVGQVSFSDGSWTIWTNNGGQFQAVARTNMQAPGMESGVLLNYLPTITTNALGDVLFPATVYRVGDPYSLNNSIWRFHDGQLRLVVREGDQAPGLPSGIVFESLNRRSYSPIITGDSGDIAFQANLTGPGIDDTNSSSIWRVHDQSLQLVAKPGMQAPGFAPGVTFSSVDSPAMNDRGQIAFRAFLNGTEPVYGASAVGIFGEDGDGTLRSLVRYDETIDVDPGLNVDQRAIKDLLFNAGSFDGFFACEFCRGESDQPYAFNNLGQVAFAAQFRGGGFGVFVTSPLLIPEPKTVPSLGAAAYLLAILYLGRQRNHGLVGSVRWPREAYAGDSNRSRSVGQLAR